MQASASMMLEQGLWMISFETIFSVVYPRTPCIPPSASGVSEAFFKAALISSKVVDFSKFTQRSTTEPSGTGTRKAIPVSFPFTAGRNDVGESSTSRPPFFWFRSVNAVLGCSNGVDGCH